MNLKTTLLASTFILFSAPAFSEEMQLNGPAPVGTPLPTVNEEGQLISTSPEAGTLPATPGSAPDGAFKYAEDNKAVWSLVWENDIFSGQDQNYTNGVRLGWTSSEASAPDWLRWSADWLPIAEGGNKRINVNVGQSIFTPDDITVAAPIVGDRPYAGWLYGSIGVTSDTGRTLDNMTLTMGVIGPAALGEETQEAIHHMINYQDPKGWGNQLDNELGVNLDYERKWRSLIEFSPFGTGMDITPHVGASLGNVYTQAVTGLTFRVGYDLPQDYGPPRIRPSLPGSDFFIPNKEVGGYLFASVEGRAVARNIFLDGNTFGDDNSTVDKKNLVGSLSVGATMTIDGTRISYTQVFMSKEFEGQEDTASFGAITVSTRF